MWRCIVNLGYDKWKEDCLLDLDSDVRGKYEGVFCIIYTEFPNLRRGTRQVFTRGSEQFAGSHIRRGRLRLDGESERELRLARDAHFAADQNFYFSAEVS